MSYQEKKNISKSHIVCSNDMQLEIQDRINSLKFKMHQ